MGTTSGLLELVTRYIWGEEDTFTAFWLLPCKCSTIRPVYEYLYMQTTVENDLHALQ